MTESLLLSAVGGALGAFLAAGGLWAIEALRPSRLTQLEAVRMDLPVLAFAAALTVGAGLLFGIVPALQLARRDVAGGMRDSLQRSSLAAERGRGRRVLVVAEVALAFVLLVGAGLMIHSFLRLQAADPGFETDGLLAVQLNLPAARYPEPAQRLELGGRLESRVRSALGPALEDVALASAMPGSAGIYFGTVHVVGQAAPLAPGATVSAGASVGPGYFRTTGIPLVEGRELTEEDVRSERDVAIVSESFARRHFPGGEALGEEFRFGSAEDSDGDTYRVVGGAGDAHQLGLSAGPTGATQVYFPYRGDLSLALIVRAGPHPLDHAGTIRRQVWALDPDLPIRDLAAGLDLLGHSFERPRFQTTLMSGFAGVAVLLAVIGVYGVLTFAVSQRVHEIGVRMALGASQRDVLGLVVRQGLSLVAAGLAVGLVGGIALARSVGSLLYELEPTDPATFGLTALALAVVGVTAAAVPALRASRVDPLVALREE